MHILLSVIGIVLVGCAILAAGLYAWHGQWLPVLLAIGAAFVGKLALGLVELVLTPLTLPSVHFAKRGNMVLSSLFATAFALVGRAAFAAYCAIVLLYYLGTPGPPRWLAVTLAVVVASAPFLWASQRNQDDMNPAHLDLAAAMLGVAISGTLLMLGVNTVLALFPLALLFFASAIGFVIWWATRGARLTRLSHYMGGDQA